MCEFFSKYNCIYVIGDIKLGNWFYFLENKIWLREDIN